MDFPGLWRNSAEDGQFADAIGHVVMEGTLELRLSELHAVLTGAVEKVPVRGGHERCIESPQGKPLLVPDLSKVVAGAGELWSRRNDVIHGIWLHGQVGEVRVCIRPKVVRERNEWKRAWAEMPTVEWTVHDLLALADGLRVAGTPVVASATGRPLTHAVRPTGALDGMSLRLRCWRIAS